MRFGGILILGGLAAGLAASGGSDAPERAEPELRDAPSPLRPPEAEATSLPWERALWSPQPGCERSIAERAGGALAEVRIAGDGRLRVAFTGREGGPAFDYVAATGELVALNEAARRLLDFREGCP